MQGPCLPCVGSSTRGIILKGGPKLWHKKYTFLPHICNLRQLMGKKQKQAGTLFPFIQLDLKFFYDSTWLSRPYWFSFSLYSENSNCEDHSRITTIKFSLEMENIIIFCLLEICQCMLWSLCKGKWEESVCSFKGIWSRTFFNEEKG